MNQENIQKEQTGKEASLGIWTPQAKVICFGCHGNIFNKGFGNIIVLDEEDMKRKAERLPLLPGNRITQCDGCGQDIQLDDSIAAEHNILVSLKACGIEANMHQTGGMNSACGINTIDGGYYLMTYNWDGDGMYVVGEYDGNGEHIDNPAYFVSDSHDDAVAHILSLGKIKRSVGAETAPDAGEQERICSICQTEEDDDTPWVCPACSSKFNE